MADIHMKIGDQEYVISSDEKQWVIGRMINKKRGFEFTAEMYFNSTAAMFSALLEKKLRASEATTLIELQRELKRAKEELQGLYDTNFNPGASK